MILCTIILLASSWHWPMPWIERGDLLFPQVAENAIHPAIAQRFDQLDEDPEYCLPLLWEANQAKLHAHLPSLSFADLIRQQTLSREFRWVNRGNKIGIEINREYYEDLLEEQRALDEDNPWFGEFKRRLRLDARIISLENALDKGDNFVEIATMPTQVFLRSGKFLGPLLPNKIIVTYSFPQKLDDQPFPPLDTRLQNVIKRSLASNPYIDFVHIDEEKEGIRASIRIVQEKEIPAEDENGGIQTGYTQTDVATGTPILVYLFPGSVEEMFHTFLHELMHALGLPHHWDAWPIADDQGKSRLLGELPKNVAAYSEHNNTTYKQTLPDSCNEAYRDIRDIRNQDLRAVSGAILSVLYHLEDPYPNGVTFKFIPTEGESFYTLENIKQPDGSSLATYRGRVAGITLSNPGIDFTDLDFRAVPAFSYPPGGYHVKWGLDSYSEGVTVYLGPDANITFNSYVPEKLDQDKNLSIDLYTKIRRVYLSSHDDWVMIPPICDNIEVYPGPGDDHIHIHARNHTIIIGQSEGIDTIQAEDNGHVMIDYGQDELDYYQKDKKYYLLAREAGETHGICLEKYDMQSSNLLIQDKMGQTINLKDKKFLPLPKGHL